MEYLNETDGDHISYNAISTIICNDVNMLRLRDHRWNISLLGQCAMQAIEQAGDDVLDHNIIILKGVSGFYLKLA